MAIFKWSTLANGQVIAFNANNDVLDVDIDVHASSAVLTRAGGVTLLIAGKSVTLQGISPENFDSTASGNIKFSVTNTLLIIGDDTRNNGADNLPNVKNGTANGDQIHGLGGNDDLKGNQGLDLIFGGTGNDLIHGGQDNDVLLGEEGQDTINGGLGNDEIRGGNDNDILEGGDGADVVYGNQNDDLIRALGTANGSDTAYGGQGNDIIDYEHATVGGQHLIYGNRDADTIKGGIKADTVFGGQGNDRIFGNDGNDLLHGNLENDVIYGNFKDDWLWGEGGNDTLFGGQNNDTVEGGIDVDRLSGGANNDTFVFNPGDSGVTAATADTITDYISADDSIDLPLAGTDLNYRELNGTGGYNEAFATAQNAMVGNVRHVFIGGTTDGYLFVDFDGNHTIDLSVILITKDLLTEFGFEDIV